MDKAASASSASAAASATTVVAYSTVGTITTITAHPTVSGDACRSIDGHVTSYIYDEQPASTATSTSPASSASAGRTVRARTTIADITSGLCWRCTACAARPV
jgi:hypothetical protein